MLVTHASETRKPLSPGHGEGGVITVESFGGEQERPELGPIHTMTLGRAHLGAADVLGGVGRDAPVDVSELLGAAHRRESPINCRGGQPVLFHGRPVQLNVGPGRP